MTEIQNLEPVETDEATTEPTETPEETPEAHETPEAPEAESFPAEYVKQLRKEAADNRAKAKRADDYARELFTARVAALGKLHDPADLAFDAELLDDPAKLAAAVDELTTRKPYMARRSLTGSAGQGATPTAPQVSLIDALRG